MNKKRKHWNDFLKTGKVDDYLKYADAEELLGDYGEILDEYNIEVATEFYVDQNDLGATFYDDQDPWYSDT